MTARGTAAELTAAQRRALLASDPETGELSAPPAVRAALRARGLAVEYGRARGHYLTDAGRQVRDRLRETPSDAPESGPRPGVPAAPAAPAGSGPGGGFDAATGDGPETGEDPRRAAAAARAWAGLVEIRRVTGHAAAGGEDGSGVPAPWERTRAVRAVSLALESAGVPPSAVDGNGRRTRTGYRVLESEEPGAVRVEWRGPSVAEARREAGERLRACVRPLAERGWEALLYWGPRRTPFLLVTPRDP